MPRKGRSRNDVGGAAALGDLPRTGAGAFLVAVAMILHLPRRESFRARTGRAGVAPYRFSEATKAILSAVATGNQTRWPEWSPSPASFQRILVSDSLCREGTRPNASFSRRAEIVGPGKPTFACCKVAVDACFLSYRICCAGSGRASRPRRSADGRSPGDAPMVGDWETGCRSGQRVERAWANQPGQDRLFTCTERTSGRKK